jgi:hypothetical protein
LFVLNKKTNRYELTSIALQQGDWNGNRNNYI